MGVCVVVGGEPNLTDILLRKFVFSGIHNSVTLWCAVMSEHKVLLVSLAAARLASACRALAALMFPFRYAHVFIPLLPAGLAEVLATPTPFLIGVHSSLKEEVSELVSKPIPAVDYLVLVCVRLSLYVNSVATSAGDPTPLNWRQFKF